MGTQKRVKNCREKLLSKLRVKMAEINCWFAYKLVHDPLVPMQKIVQKYPLLFEI
jgi:hypothetical protein